jgi:hypothetical protein
MDEKKQHQPGQHQEKQRQHELEDRPENRRQPDRRDQQTSIAEEIESDARTARKKEAGEKAAGKYHYNPGNMSGKTIESSKPEGEQRANADRKQNRQPLPKGRDA